MNKETRQSILKKVISENNIENQSELIKCLEKENVRTTQSTISRDMRELNIIKKVIILVVGRIIVFWMIIRLQKRN